VLIVVSGLLLALLNALTFHLGVERRFTSVSNGGLLIGTRRRSHRALPTLWAAIVVTGRFVAYNWFPPMP
jgi:hypothetical protein